MGSDGLRAAFSRLVGGLALLCFCGCLLGGPAADELFNAALGFTGAWLLLNPFVLLGVLVGLFIGNS